MHQLLPQERRGFHVVGAATEGANAAAQVPGQCTQAAARQFGEEPASDVVCADDVERRLAAGQVPEERLLKSSEVDHRWRRLGRKPRRVVNQLAPGELWIDAVAHHRVRETCYSRYGWWNLFAL